MCTKALELVGRGRCVYQILLINIHLACFPLLLRHHHLCFWFVPVRNVTGITDEALTEKLHYVKTKGFINYFGMQRYKFMSTPSILSFIVVIKTRVQAAVIPEKLLC